jgi:hypothetical protein
MLIRRRRTALSKTPHALVDGLMLVFKHPGRAVGFEIAGACRPGHALPGGAGCKRILYTAWMSNGSRVTVGIVPWPVRRPPGCVLQPVSSCAKVGQLTRGSA